MRIFTSVSLTAVDFTAADLTGANLRSARLSESVFVRTILAEADFTSLSLARTSFVDVDLSTVRGLETIEYLETSTMNLETARRSKEKLPEIFLKNVIISDIHS